MNVFVVNAYAYRRSKYSDKYEMYPALWWENIATEQTEQFSFRHNCRVPLRKKITACTLSHLNLIQKIIDEDLKDVVILEDDCVIKDFELLNEIKHLLPENEFIYLGGQVNAPLVKDYNTFTKSNKKGIIDHLDNDNNLIKEIDTDTFRITHACSYYIPNKIVAERILSSIKQLYDHRKMRAIDVMLWELQKKKVIKYFVFPALGTLFLEDAKQGYTYSSGYKLQDNQIKY